jgi:hydroxymethylglutaryl-CoA reductase
MCHEILGNPDAGELSRIAACVGLAQNFAALRALVTEGIQKGHMKLHARKLAFEAGARGQLLNQVASRIVAEDAFSPEKAKAIYDSFKEES